MAMQIKSLMSTRRGKTIAIVIIVVVVAIIGFVADLLYQNIRYVTTENARIAAPMIAVVAQNSCQMITMKVDLGSYVKQGQAIAEVGQPRTFDPSNREGSKADPIGRVTVEAPVSGYIAAVWTYPGAIMSAGGQIVTIFDTSNVWVSANIEETKINKIKPGQPVEIKIDSLNGATLTGTVDGIAPATAATFSLLPQSNSSGSFVKVTQVVPVKISVNNNNGSLLIPGTSVEVKIDVQ
jgi:multidrug resistance efflux pump